MKPRLCRTPEGLIIHPGETVAIEPPLIGCFVTAALYSAAAVVTHCGPGMNDLTCSYHRNLRPEPLAPSRLVVLSLDLAATTLWHRRRRDYLAAALKIPADSIQTQTYPVFADIALLFHPDGKLQIDGLT